MTAQKKYITSLLSIFSTFLESNNVSRNLALLTTEKFVVFINKRKKSDVSWYKNWSTKELENFISAQNVPHKPAFLIRKFIKQYTPLEIDIFLHEFLTSLKSDNRSNSTIKNYRSDIQQFSSFVKSTQIKKLFEPDNLRSFVHSQLDNGLKISTIKRKLSSISQFALWAEEEKIVQDASFWISDIKSLYTAPAPSHKFNNKLKTSIKPENQKTASKEAELVDLANLLKIDRIDNLKNILANEDEFVNHKDCSKNYADVELPGIEPGRSGLSIRSSKPANPTSKLNISQKRKQIKPKSPHKQLEDFLINLKINGHSKSTIRNYKSDINQFFKYTKKNTTLPISELDKLSNIVSKNNNLPSNKFNLENIVTEKQIIKFVISQKKSGLQISSIKRKITSISQFALWAENKNALVGVSSWIHQLPNQLFKRKQQTPKTLSSNYQDNTATTTQKFELKLKPNNLIHAHHNKIHPKKQGWSLPIPDFDADKSVSSSSNNFNQNNKHSFKKNKDNKNQANHKSNNTQENKNVYSGIKSSLQDFANQINTKRNQKFLPYLNLGMMILFVVGLGVLGYQQFITQAPTPFAYPSSPTRPNRELSFQGRLTDTAQNPITTATDMAFRLYDNTSGGTQLWSSGTCSVTPDQDGIFNVGLGDDCGSEITENVFTENSNVWLEVEIDSETLTPRQSIKTVAYALNSETVQGYPVSATGAATVNTILVMDDGGQVLLGEVSPTLKATSGTFSIEAQALTLQTSSSSNGNIILDPDGLGEVLSTGYFSAPGATFSATYAGGTSLVLKGGPGGTGNIQEWQDSSGAVLSVVDASGNVGVGGNNPTSSLDIINQALNNIGEFNFTDSSIDHGITSIRGTNTYGSLGAISASNGGLGITGISDSPSTTAFYFRGLIGDSNPDDSVPAFLMVSGKQNGTTWQKTGDNETSFQFRNYASNLLTILGSGNIGIGTTTPLFLLDVAGTASVNSLNINDAYTFPTSDGSTDYILQTNGSGSVTWEDPSNITGAGLWANTLNVFHPKNELASVVDLVLGGTSTASANIHLQSNGNATFTGNVNVGGSGITDSLKVYGDYGQVSLYESDQSDKQWTMEVTGSNYQIAEVGVNSRFVLIAGGDTNITNANVNLSDTNYLATDWIRARDADGLQLYDDGGNGIFVEDGGFIGIGTTNPAAPLDIYIDNTDSQDPGLRIQQDGTGDASTVYLLTGVRNWATGVDNSDADKFKIGMSSYLATNNFFTIDINGNTGIGTTSPDYKLDVVGDIKIENGSDLYTYSGASYSETLGNRTYTEDNYVTDAQTLTASVDALDQAVYDISTISTLFTDGGTTTYLTSLTDDFAIGSTSLVAPFSVDESAQTIRIGEGSVANAQLNMFASDGDTGNITFNTNDQWYFTGGDVDFNQHLAVGTAGTINANYTATIYENYASLGSGTSISLNLSQTRTESSAITASTTALGINNILAYNMTEDLVTPYHGYGYAANNTSYASGTSTFSWIRGSSNSAYTNSTAATNQDSIAGTYNNAFNNSSGTLTNAFGTYNQTYAASTGTVISAYGSSNNVFSNAAGATINTAKGVYARVYEGAGTVITGIAGDFVCDDATTCYGLNVSADDAQPTTNYGIVITAANGTTSNYGILGTTGDWVLDEDGNGYAGGTGAGGDLFLGEGQDLELYHDGTNSYITNNTGDLYIGDAGTDDVILSNNGGNVGIGTTNPLRLLDIRGDLYQYSTNPVIQIRNVSSSNTVGLDIGVGSFGTAADGYIINTNTGASSADLHFGTNNTIDMTILYGGNVGIGTTGPSEILHIEKLNSGANSIGLRVSNPGAGVGNAISIDFQNFTTSGQGARIQSYRSNAGNFDSDLVFYTNTGGTSTAITEKMRITDDGNVGIGTTSPEELMHVDGNLQLGSDPYLYWKSNTLNLKTKADAIPVVAIRGATSYDSRLDMFQAGDVTKGVVLNTNGYTYFNGGNIGIGTTSPSSFKLEVDGNVGPALDNTYSLGSASRRWANIYSSGNIIATGLWDADIDTGIQVEETADEDIIRFDTAGSERMVIDASGNVGIGTSDPSQKLEISQTGTGTIQSFLSLIPTGNTDGSGATIDFRTSNSVLANRYMARIAGVRDGSGATSSLRFYTETGSSLDEQMRIDSTGNIGIGTTTPSGLLDITGSATGQALVQLQEMGDQDILTASNSAGVSRFRIANTGYTYAERFLDISGPEYYLDPDSDTISMVVASNVGIGTTSPVSLLNVEETNTAAVLTLSNSSTTTLTGDSMGKLDFYTNDNSTITDRVVASIQSIAEANYVGTDDAATSLTFNTHGGASIAGSSTGEKMRITSTGNIGIGTTSPKAKLHIYDSASSATIMTSSVVNDADGAFLRLTEGDNATYGFLGGFMQYDGDDNLLNIGVHNIQDNTYANDIKAISILRSNGNVGIGTATPTNFKLEISGHIGPSATASNNLGSDSLRWKKLYLSNDQDLHIGSSTTDEGTIKYATATNILLFTNNYGDTNFTTSSDGFNFTLGGGAGDDFSLFSASGSEEPLFIVESDTGNVGIGTTPPSYKLDVNGTGRFVGDLTVDGNDLIFGNGSTISNSINGNLRIHGDGVINLRGNNSGSYFGIGDAAGGAYNTHFFYGATDDIYLSYGTSGVLHTRSGGTETLNLNASGQLGLLGAIRTGSITETAYNHFGSGGTVNYADNASDVYIQDELEVDGLSYFGNDVDVTGDVTVNTGSDFNLGKSDFYITNDQTNRLLLNASTYNTDDTGWVTVAGSGTVGEVLFYVYNQHSSHLHNEFIVYGNGTTFTRGSHDYAENILTNDLTTEAADLVIIDPDKENELISHGSESIKTTWVKKTTKPYDNTVIGIISTTPGSLLGAWLDEDEFPGQVKPLALSGRTSLKVTSKNGVIKRGDAITTSDIAGIGMKSTRAGQIVGKTLEEFDPSKLTCTDVQSVESIQWPTDTGSNNSNPCFKLPDGNYVGKAIVFINVTYYDPNIYLTYSGAVSLHKNDITGEYTTSLTSTNLPINLIEAFADVITANLTAGLTTTKELIVETTATITDLSVNTITINGQPISEYITDVVGNINPNNSSTTTSALISPVANDTVINIATQSGQIAFTNNNDETVATISETGNLNLTGSINLDGSLSANGNTTILGNLTTNSITATGSSTLGSLLITTNATISGTLTTDNLLANTTSIGSLLAQDATVSGTLKTGTLITDQIEATSSRIALLEAGMAELAHVKATTAEIVTATISGTLYANSIYANSIYDFEETLATVLQQPSLLDIITGTNQSTTSATAMADLYNTVNKSEYNSTSSADLDLSFSEISMTSNDVTITGTALFIEKYFKVNGAGYIADSLAVGNSIFINNSLVVGDENSNTSLTSGVIAYKTQNPNNQILKIQPEGQGSIELLAGIVVIDDSGKVTVNGDFDITGNAKIAGTLLTDQLKPTDFGNPLQVQVAGIDTETNEIKKSRFEIINEVGTPVATFSAEGNAEFSGDVGVQGNLNIGGELRIESQDLGSSDTNELTADKTSGKATILSGANEVMINSSIISDNTLIYVTAVGSTNNQVIYVKSQDAENTETPEQEGKFVVGFDNNTTSDVSFNWWIVN